MARHDDHGSGGVAVLTIFRVSETGSTNADMLVRATEGRAHEGDWLVAKMQTAGRGRRGRVWLSPPGNLYASALVEVRVADPPAATLALVAGIAIWDALAIVGAWLKWPNDVVQATTYAKIAGTLLERQGNCIVIGIGANLAHHPDLDDRATTSLAALGFPLLAEDALASLVAAFARWLDIWRTYGLEPVRTAWLERAHPVGTQLFTELPDGSRMDGTFDGLTNDCALRLRLADGSVRVIHAGDVSLVQD